MTAAEVEIWRVDLDAPGAADVSVLSAAERARAERFVRPRHRDRFAAGRAALRGILAAALGVEPAALGFESGAWGKPALAPPHAGSGLTFNLSHCEGLMLCAVGSGRAIGIDVERERDDIDPLGLARRYFSADEIRQLERLPAAVRHAGFAAGWTRKEAYIKAVGRGLSMALDRFTVSLVPDAPAALLDVDGDRVERDRWTMAAFRPGPALAAAIVAEGADWKPVHRRWREDEGLSMR